MKPHELQELLQRNLGELWLAGLGYCVTLSRPGGAYHHVAHVVIDNRIFAWLLHDRIENDAFMVCVLVR